MSQASTQILYTKNLNIGYAGKTIKTILSDINVSISPGELVCFLGPNGVGKSTLLRTIAGVQKPLQGEVIVNQQPLAQLSLTERAKQISLVLTERVSGGNLSVRELVALGRHPYTNWAGNLSPQDLTKVEEAITLTNIESLTTQKLYTLSDGQRQKVMIARALAQDSAIMILDEPTTHLDLNNRLEIMSLLLRMARTTNKAILVATHELDLALQTADRLWLAAFTEPILTGIPEDLALNGAIEKTFFKNETRFDLLTGRFSLPHTSSILIKLTGEHAERQWTQYALQRVGYLVDDQKGVIHIHTKKEQGKASWIVKGFQNHITCTSLEELLNILKVNFEAR